jgi:thymidine phosphorylase
VARGDVLAEVHARDAAAAEHAVERLQGAIVIGDEPVAALPVLIETSG